MTERSVASRSLQSIVDTILDTIVDGVVTIDESGKILSFNKACTRLFGYSVEDVLGKNVSILMPSPYRENHDGYLKNYLSTGIAKIIGIGREVSGQRKDGTTFPMELAIGATPKGTAHAFVGIIRDISERKEADKEREQLRQAQKMEALGQLTGGIAHDFNNILAIIMGNLDFLYEKTDDQDPLREYIQPSIEAAEHGSELTQRLLAFGRKQTLQPKVISVNDLITSMSKLAKRTLGERIEIRLSLAQDLWNTKIDPRQLENALLNLSINARDAMPKGGKLIYETQNIYLDENYAAHNLDVVPGDYALVAISDTGTGMTPEIIEKAFEPFFTTKTVGKGSGLGLSMVYGFVKQSRGHIKIYSEVGQGTSVKIYLPRSLDDAAIMEEKVTILPVNTENKGKTILVVEDNPEVLKLTSSIVESLGYTVITALTGDAALKIINEKGATIDLLLTDVMLPGEINGPVLARQAKAQYPNLRVLFNSGYAEHAIFQSGLLDEGVHLIGKPFRKQQLAEKIQEVLK